MELNYWRRPEPQARGETRLRSNHYLIFGRTPQRRLVDADLQKQRRNSGDLWQHCRGIVWLRELFQLRTSHRGPVACRMANNKTSAAPTGTQERVVEKQANQEKAHENLPRTGGSMLDRDARNGHGGFHLHFHDNLTVRRGQEDVLQKVPEEPQGRRRGSSPGER